MNKNVRSEGAFDVESELLQLSLFEHRKAHTYLERMDLLLSAFLNPFLKLLTLIFLLHSLFKLFIAATIRDGLAKLLFLVRGEAVKLHCECLEIGLSRQDCEKGSHALYAPLFKPVILVIDDKVLKLVEVESVGQGCHKLVPLFCGAHRAHQL